MKRSQLFLSIFTFLIIATFSLSGCKKDGKEPFDLVGVWTAIDTDERTDYYTLTLNSNSTFALRIDYGAQNSMNHETYTGNYTYSEELMYLWLESVWEEGSPKAQSGFKIYSNTNTEMVTSSFYAGDRKFTWTKK